MKRLFRLMFVALIFTATMGLTSCESERDNGNNDTQSIQDSPDMPTFETLEHTEWEGFYSTTAQTQYGPMALSIRWTLDFLSNGQASVMMVFDSQAFDDTPYEWSSAYTYDPATGTGVLSDKNLNNVSFSVDAVNRTLTADLVIYVQHEEGGETIPYGGTTILHQTL